MVRIAARTCPRRMVLLCSSRLGTYPPRPLYSQLRQPPANALVQISLLGRSQHNATPHPSSTPSRPRFFASSLTSSRFPALRFVCLEPFISCWRENLVRFRKAVRRRRGLWLALAVLFIASRAIGQGPAPETAPPLFPGGALISYNSIFTTRGLMPGMSAGVSATARPTFAHEGDFNFTWGFCRNFDLTLLVPVVTNHFETPRTPVAGGTGLGDAMVLVKYRFYRRDSPRGTTQASVTFGPKIPTGQTNLTDRNANLLPVSLQPGSGSTDLFLAANWTYTGLFNVRRLVADGDFHSLIRSEGTRATRLGSDLESRFWLSYRPYESKNGNREWFVGPVFTWLHSQDDRISDATQRGSGGDALLAGITTYVGVRAGVHVWFGMDWDAAHSTGASFMPVRRHISFGITQQFRLHL
jgi:hypothetical protein